MPPPDEWVALDCETTGLNVRTDEIIAIGAVRIVGNRIMTSERLELLVRPEQGRVGRERAHPPPARARRGAGPADRRGHEASCCASLAAGPLVGYYLEFDVAMLNRALWPMLGMGCRSPPSRSRRCITTTSSGSCRPTSSRPTPTIDLRFATLMDDLGLAGARCARRLNDAVMAALAFVKLRHLQRH
jgi:DNA polymerase-3 subunit epsilon